MAGWRLGCIVAPAALLEPLLKLWEQTASFVPPFVQLAGLAALQGPQGHLAQWREDCSELPTGYWKAWRVSPAFRSRYSRSIHELAPGTGTPSAPPGTRIDLAPVAPGDKSTADASQPPVQEEPFAGLKVSLLTERGWYESSPG